MKKYEYKDEYTFLNELFSYLEKELKGLFDIKMEEFFKGSKVDILLTTHHGRKNIILEIKASRGDTLPFSTVLTLENLKTTEAEIILISLSDMSEHLKRRAKELNVKFLIKPEFIDIKTELLTFI